MQSVRLIQALEELSDNVNSAADKAGKKVEDFIQNETALVGLTQLVYQRLPLFIRMIIHEPIFVEFVLQHKEKLLLHNKIGEVIGEFSQRWFSR